MESGWNLVETAWGLGISRNLLNVHYDGEKKLFFVNNELRRKDVTAARNALNGYQKGRCFYCFSHVGVDIGSENLCDVDHFFPHILKHIYPSINIDGIWNLVLTCQKCNRGEQGKFTKVPEIKYLERLHRRNEFLISSHDPLRETLINQIGGSEEIRRVFLLNVDKKAIRTLIYRWSTEQIGEEVF